MPVSETTGSWNGAVLEIEISRKVTVNAPAAGTAIGNANVKLFAVQVNVTTMLLVEYVNTPVLGGFVQSKLSNSNVITFAEVKARLKVIRKAMFVNSLFANTELYVADTVQKP